MAELRIGVPVAPDVAVFADGGINLLGGGHRFPGQPSEIALPGMRVLQYLAGVEAVVAPPADGWAWIIAEATAGARTFSSDSFQSVDGGEVDFQHTYFTAGGGLQIGYPVAPNLDLVGHGRLLWSPVKEEDTSHLAALARMDPFGGALTMPLSIALRARI